MLLFSYIHTDGGPDQNLTFLSTQILYSYIFHIIDHDVFLTAVKTKPTITLGRIQCTKVTMNTTTVWFDKQWGKTLKN